MSERDRSADNMVDNLRSLLPPGALVHGVVIIVEYSDPDPDEIDEGPFLQTLISDQLPVWRAMGMLHWLTAGLEHAARRMRGE